MLESLGALTGSPWIYAVVAVSVLLDVFLPVLPSGVLVITTATAAAAGSTTAAGVAAVGAAGRVAQQVPREVPSLLLLMLCAVVASVLGDLLAFRLARRDGSRITRAIARSRRLTTAQQRLGNALGGGGGLLVVIARFAPAGRSVVSLGAGAAHREVKEFLPWSALAGVAWTGYSAGLGYFGARWLGAGWIGALVSVLALFLAGSLAAYVIRRPPSAGAAGATA
ncbi:MULTISPECIES: DedA family protein [unclassified Streptomyces]|uniref:DedA family protein n=1 Tax=unclassified Streptomyces TaxID=2593676 RepID=UPI0004C67B64|nr:VTT domain-containing protein [Streptomyces sp. NRRL F-5135]